MDICVNTTLEKDLRYIWHPFTQMQTAEAPIVIERAEGAYLYASCGTRYLDAISSWWVNLHGHSHPYIAQKIQAQAQKLEHVIFADFTHAPAAELGQRLINLLPGKLAKLFYSDNGSTAVETALKIALQYWYNLNIPKTEIICFKNSYHGDTFGAMSAAGKNGFNRPFWNKLFKVKSIDPPLAGRQERSLKQLKALIDKGKTACFIYEPLVLGAGGMITYPADGLDALLDYCRKQNVLIIADEVMTGFGRTNSLFASEQMEIQPDMICLSKGITGGFLPLGATACAQQIYDAFLDSSLNNAFLHGHSYCANPLACASALASLDLLLHESCFAQRKTIAAFHKEFCLSLQNHPKLQRCESLGTLLVVEYRSPNTNYFQSLRDTLYRYFLEHKVLLRPLGNVLYCMPPYCITKEELELIYSLINSTLYIF